MLFKHLQNICFLDDLEIEFVGWDNLVCQSCVCYCLFHNVNYYCKIVTCRCTDSTSKLNGWIAVFLWRIMVKQIAFCVHTVCYRCVHRRFNISDSQERTLHLEVLEISEASWRLGGIWAGGQTLWEYTFAKILLIMVLVHMEGGMLLLNLRMTWVSL